MSLKKYFFFLIIFGILVLILLFPRTSLATITGSGCEGASTIDYETECGENFNIGSCHWRDCECHDCNCDEEGNCNTCCDSCRECSCSGLWDEYQCASFDCDEDIKIRTCEVYEGGSSCSSGNCGNEKCCVDCSSADTCEECGSWQKPVSDSSCDDPGCEEWCKEKPGCKCCGECIAAPSGLRYYDNPNYPTDPCNPEPGIGSANIKLPVKLDWDDVEGWKDGWCSGGGYELADACGNMRTAASVSPYKQCCKAKEQACIEARSAEINWDELTSCEKRCKLAYIEDECKWTHYQVECLHEVWEGTPVGPEPSASSGDCVTGDCPYPDLRYNPSEMVQYYEIRIEGEMRDSAGNAMSNYSANLDQSEFVPPNPCFFKSNREYTWSVRACCGNGDCGPAATSTFTTSLAPEPIWPYDPDWAGPDRAEPSWATPTVETPNPVHLEWCSVDEAKSYCIRMYKPGTPFIRMYGQGTPFCPVLFSELFCPAVVPPSKDIPIQSYFDFGLDAFTKETDYQWKISTCLGDEIGHQCGLSCPENKVCYMFETLKSECACCDFSQLWNFFGLVTLSTPELIAPEDGGCVNLSHRLEWTHVPGANSYRYQIYLMNGVSSLLIEEHTIPEYIPIRDLWDRGILTINKKYAWRVQPCWDENGLNCENGSWSNGGELWEFTTTGAAPTGSEPPNGTADILIPIGLDWDDMSCAASYKYKVTAPDGSTVTEGVITGVGIPPSKISVNYNSDIGHPRQGTDYFWEVWTCADTEGSICGSPASASLTTFDLSAPGNPQPCDGCDFYTDEHYLRWDSVLGAAFYWYELDGEATIVPSNSAFIDTSGLGLGTHTWVVYPCIDKDCYEKGPPGNWSLKLVEAEAPAGKGGIVPCGKYTDNPNTPWNEREHCGIQHVFIMIFSIIDFLLWKVLPILLVLLALASGVIFYFSGQLGIADPPSQVKSLWKAAGIGLAVVFLAWAGISLILGLFGYQVGLFGPWWKISF